MEWSAPRILLLVAVLAALAVVRALAAALEAALVAVGVPRAQALGAATGAAPGARALASLAAEPEVTAFAIRFVGAFSVLAMGGLAGATAALLLPATPFLAGACGGAGGRGAAGAGRHARAGHRGGQRRGGGAGAGEPLPGGPRSCSGRWPGWSPWPPSAAGGSPCRRPPLAEMERKLDELAKARGGGTSELIHNVFEFREKVARDVMVPRTEVVGVEIDTPVPDIIRLLAEEGHSRMPIYRGDLDHIVGVLHARDLVPLLVHPELIVLRDLIRPAHFVPWSKPIEQLLREMQRRKLHMAFVVDEFGGVMGLCTIEDVLEQIVGEIQDEFEDDEEGGLVEGHPDGTFTAQGAAPISELNRVAAAGVPEDQGYETVGGFVSSLAGAIPVRGDRIPGATGSSRWSTPIRAG